MLATVFVFAQRGASDPDTRIQKKVDRMTEQLNLSADQQMQVKELLVTQYENRKAIKGKKGEMTETEKTEKKEVRKAAKAEYDAKLAGILTPEQNATFQEAKKNKKRKGKAKNHKGKRKGKGGASKKSPEERTQNRVAKLTEELSLTETQQVQLTELMASKPQYKMKKGKNKMTEEERATMKAERKASKEAYNAKFEQILTPEQLAIHEANKTAKKEKRQEKKMNKKKANKQ